MTTPEEEQRKLSERLEISARGAKKQRISPSVHLIPNERPGMDHAKGWTRFGDDFRARWVEKDNQLVIATPTGNLVMHPVTENFVYLEVEQ